MFILSAERCTALSRWVIGSVWDTSTGGSRIPYASKTSLALKALSVKAARFSLRRLLLLIRSFYLWLFDGGVIISYINIYKNLMK